MDLMVMTHEGHAITPAPSHEWLTVLFGDLVGSITFICFVMIAHNLFLLTPLHFRAWYCLNTLETP